MKKNILVIGVLLLIGGVIVLLISGIRETETMARSINDDDLRVYLEAGEYHIHASYSVREDHPKIKIYDPYGNLIYEKDYVPELDFRTPTTGFHSIHVTNMWTGNSVLEVSRIWYRFKGLFPLGISLIALGVGSIIVGIIKPYKEQREVSGRLES